MKDKERKIITYHELGHAITAYHLENADPVEKISIVSRGMALGVTWMMPKEDSYLNSKAKFSDEIVSLLGGRASEEIVFGKDEITTGASNDFEKVTNISTQMITKYGMDEEIGTISYSFKENKEYQMFKPYSDITSQQIDKKIQNIVKNAYEKAIKILNENRKLMDILAEVLLEKEYLTKEEFEEIMKNPKKANKILKEFKIIKEKKTNLEKKDIIEVQDDEKLKKNDKNDKKENNDKKTQKEKMKDMLDKFLS
nr:hypothetical protein [Candidatus Vampirococcus lugosii]